MNLGKWINENTKDSKCVVELGSMFFEQLSKVHHSVLKKIGIEIWPPYIQRARYYDCIKIHGDIREFEALVDKDDMDCCLMVDVLEHFDKETAIDLVKRIKENFNKFLLFIPEGVHPQTKDFFKLGADKYQTHRSTWRANEIAEELGIKEENMFYAPRYHNEPGKASGAVFAIWEKLG